MRIALYCGDFYPSVSGYSFAFQDLAIGLASHPTGVEIDVFTPVPLGERNELTLPFVRVIRLDLPERFTGIKFIPALWNLFAKPWLSARAIAAAHSKQPYDLLLAETIEDPLTLRFLPADLRACTAIRVHATTETEVALWGPGLVLAVRRRLIRHVLRRHIRFITATSRHYLSFVRKWYFDEDQLLIASKRFAVVENSAPALNAVPRLGFAEPNRVRFMTLGRMDWVGTNQKGFDDILLALLHLKPSVRQRVHLTVIGKGSERARLLRLAAAIQEATIEFIESMPNHEVREHLQRVDCTILASRYEGMSVFALEALSSASPVIFSDAGGIADLVDGNGFRYPAGDGQALARCLEQFVALADIDLHRMSERSLQIAARYTPAAAAERLIEFSRLITAEASVASRKQQGG